MSKPAISKSVIEEEAIRIINSNLPINHCQSFIKISSTEASFDGYINYFDDRSKSDKEGMMPIHVQVKGTTLDFEKNTVSIDVADLKNYVASGVCYLVIRMVFNKECNEVTSHRILGKNIIGREALDILKDKENQQTITIPLIEIKTKEDFTDLFKVFKYKQEMVSLHNYIDISKIKKGKITLIGENNKIVAVPKLGETYFATFATEDKICFAHNFKIQWEILPIMDEVKVKNTVFFNAYENKITAMMSTS